MTWATDARRRARAKRTALGWSADAFASADDVLARLASQTGIIRQALPPGDPLLAGAQAVLDTLGCAIYEAASLPLPLRRFHAAHEYAHLFLHGGDCRCAEPDLDPGPDTDPLPVGLGRIGEPSPRQRKEAEANVYAAELLLPGPLARRLFLEDALPASALAARLGLPPALACAQLVDALLLPDAGLSASPSHSPDVGRGRTTPPPTPAPPLDPSQHAAACAPEGPVLLGAGPGTGKTKTLVGRCLYLAREQGVPPERILALTFSNKAAQEMRERLAAAGVGGLSAQPWVGTFHAFGLDILRQFHDALGLPQDLRLLDTLDAATLLENHLPRLRLDALDNLYNPALHLSAIVRALSRAKDELCDPARYAALAGEMQQAAAAARALSDKPKPLQKDRDALENLQTDARKAAEVAHVYAVYQDLLAENGLVDFGDLLYRSVGLLEARPDLRAQLQARFPHVLADEYQDVNRACARLVQLLAGDGGQGLWAVGDHRQSIYRFRGASPANVTAFETDYPGGRRLELAVNYRSRAPLVACFGAAAAAMGAAGGAAFAGWTAHRRPEGASAVSPVTFAVAPDEDGQAQGIVRTIKSLQAEGRPLRDMAGLCATHRQAEALAEALAAHGVPALYGGNLLERSDVKNLLCILSLRTGGEGLARAAALPEYGVALPDALTVAARVRERALPFPDALQDPSLWDNLSASAQDGMARLARHALALGGPGSRPAALLKTYLLEQSDYLRLLWSQTEDPFARAGRLMGISQLLALAESYDKRGIVPARPPEAPPLPPCPARDFLAHLRRLAAAGETLRGALPEAAGSLDAVRVLTAHAAKGLEYPVVFVPNVSAGEFPARGHGGSVPEPPGLRADCADDSAEGECLFFVALSRARDHLIVSRSETKNGRPLPPSPLLGLVQEWRDAQGLADTLWPSGRPAPAPEAPPEPLPSADLPVHSASALEQYQKCPRQYFYERECRLPGGGTNSAYPQFHGCVHAALTWLDDARLAHPTPPTEEALYAHLETLWAERGPVGHWHEARYRDAARQMLRVALSCAAEAPAALPVPLTAALEGCHVRVHPDRALEGEDGALVLVRHRTGKPSEGDHRAPRLALLRRAAVETYPGRTVRIELRYLQDGTRREVSGDPPGKRAYEPARLAGYERAAHGIARRCFPAQPSAPDACASCAFALICPL